MMFKTLSKQLFLIILFIVNILSIEAHIYQSDANSKDSLMVGIAGEEPFAFEKEDKGVAVEIWNEIADKNFWKYKSILFENVEDALEALKKGELDVVVGPISITSNRLEEVRFSQPFYNSSISILSLERKKSLWQKIKPLFSPKLLMAVGFFLIILAIVGALLWLAERKESPDQFHTNPIKGIGSGMWLAIVTMTTTGYGDMAPITLLGRVITGAWMIISIIFATSMIAGIASILTLTTLDTNKIYTLEQLSGRKVATVAESTAESYLKNYKIRTVGTDNLDEAIELLENKSVDAVVFDRPQLLYYLTNNSNEKFYLSKAEYSKQGYGFAFSPKSELVFNVNRTLLELAEKEQVERIINYYIKKDE